MRVRRYMFAVASGIVFGTIWAAVLVDFEPRWYEVAPWYYQLALLVAPLVATVLCSAVLEWWTAIVQAAYTSALMVVWVAGWVQNELHYAGGLGHTDLVSQSLFHATGMLLVGVAWAAGRFARKGVERLVLARRRTDA